MIIRSFSPSLGVAYYNNLGVIHLGLEKPTLACLYLQKALQELKNVEKSCKKTYSCSIYNHYYLLNFRFVAEKTKNLYSNESEVGLQLCYNLGVTLLYMNKPAQAFDFLVEVVKTQSMNPRLWLRLAECCIRVHKQVSMNESPLV